MRAILLSALLCACSSTPSAADPDASPASQPATSERAKIDRLLVSIRESGLVFIRNGSEHSGEEAASHLETKLSQAGDRIKTARDFIEHLASRSSMTGETYLVRVGGRTLASRDWLLERLAEIEQGKR